MTVEPFIWLLAGALASGAAGWWMLRRARARRREALRERDRRLEELRREHTERVERLRRERDRAREAGHVDFVTELLSALDSLERAQSEIENHSADIEGLEEGLAMARREIDDTLEAFDVERIEPERREAFDPELHEAIRAVDDADADSGSVLECHRPGYRFENRILRAAAVAVSVEPRDAGEEAPDAPRGDDGETEDAEATAPADAPEEPERTSDERGESEPQRAEESAASSQT